MPQRKFLIESWIPDLDCQVDDVPAAVRVRRPEIQGLSPSSGHNFWRQAFVPPADADPSFDEEAALALVLEQVQLLRAR